MGTQTGAGHGAPEMEVCVVVNQDMSDDSSTLTGKTGELDGE